MLLTGLLVLPMASPVLRPAAWVRYTAALHLRPGKQETASTGPLPQFYADRFGWNEQVALVLQAYRSLTTDEQRRVCIFGSNYGEAGAVDLLGHQQIPTLPPAISGQNSYWTWGTHGCDPNVAIAIVGDSRADLEQKYQSVTLIGRPTAPYAMPFELRRGVWLLKGRRADAPLHWEDERFYY